MIQTRNALALALAAALGLALTGCGSESDQSPAAGAESSGAETLGMTSGQPDPVEQARRDAQAATEAAGEQDPLANLSDDTAEGALEAYLAALAMGEFGVAAEYCHPDAPGTAKLIRIDESMRDPEVQSMGVMGFLTEGLDQAVYEVVEPGEARVLYEVTLPGKSPAEITVVKLDDGWRVIPPEQTGLPAS